MGCCIEKANFLFLFYQGYKATSSIVHFFNPSFSSYLFQAFYPIYETFYKNRGVTLSILQVTDFVERLMKHASNGEVLMFKKPLDARLHQLITSNPELNLATVAELEFISNFQAIQVSTLEHHF